MRRMLIAGVVALAVIIVTAGVTQAGSGNRRASTSGSRLEHVAPDLTSQLDELVSGIPEMRTFLPEGDVDCGTLRCLNRYLTQLLKGLNKFEDQMLTFKADATLFRKTFNTCFRIIPVTQYGENPAGGTHGYVYSFPDNTFFKTTALDVTFGTDVIGAYMMVWRIAPECPVTE